YTLGKRAMRLRMSTMLDVQVGIAMVPGLWGGIRVEQHGGTFQHHIHLGVLDQKIKDLLDIPRIFLKNDAPESHSALGRRGIATARIADLELGLLPQFIPRGCGQQDATDTKPPFLAADIDVAP